MMKLLKRKILFALASEADFFNRSEGFEYKPYRFLYWRLYDYQESSIRDAILQLVDSDEVDKILRNNVPLFRLTSKGRDRLLSFFIISIGQKKIWDRIWRVALISTKNKSSSREKDKKIRDNNLKELRKLREGLRKIGLKKFSSGVYISPLPISAEIKSFSLKNNFLNAQIAVIESRRLLIGDNEQVANQIWQLDSLLEEYRNFINKIKGLLRILKTKKRLLKKEKNQFSLILNLLFSLLEADPGLPRKLLPQDWQADLAKEFFLKLALKVKELEEK